MSMKIKFKLESDGTNVNAEYVDNDTPVDLQKARTFVSELLQATLIQLRTEMPCDHYWQTVSTEEDGKFIKIEHMVCTKCKKEQSVPIKPECEHYWVDGRTDGIPHRFCVWCHDLEKLDK